MVSDQANMQVNMYVRKYPPVVGLQSAMGAAAVPYAAARAFSGLGRTELAVSHSGYTCVQAFPARVPV